MVFRTLLVALLLTTMSCDIGVAFLFADDCPAPAPCSCTGSADHAFISCNNNQLTSLPQFHTSQFHSKDVIVFLNDNNLTSIPNNAFSNLQSMNAATIHLQLDSNKLLHVEMFAFRGIENAVTILQLQNNKLTSIPSAVGKLHSLNYLDITGNPLRTLGTSALLGIAPSLETLYIELKTFPIWPNDLLLLHKLEHLTISNVPYAHIDSDIFQGFEKSLTTLTVKQAPVLKKLPSAICRLSKLTLLSIEHFDGLSADDDSLFENCTQQIRSLSTFTLEFSNVTIFPAIFNIFPAVSTLNLVGNSLEFIEADTIPSDNAVTKIDLDSNNFARIPSALSKMKNLTLIDLTNNAIVSVEDVDLAGLLQLKTLRLVDNPLRHISHHAFDNNKQLAVLELRNTELRNIPIAVTKLTHLTDLDLRGTQISCNCDMGYLRGWDIRSILSFDGECTDSHADIANFIKNSLQQCPK